MAMPFQILNGSFSEIHELINTKSLSCGDTVQIHAIAK